MPCTVKEAVKMVFEPAPQGTKEEIMPGVFVQIDGYYVSGDGAYKMPLVSMMSDYKWQLNCLLDRLFHPDNYTETWHGDVTHLINWLNEHEPEQYKGFRYDFKGLFDYVMSLPENELKTAEKQIKEAFKYIR